MSFCPSCGTPTSGATFCVKCGANLAAQPAPPPMQSVAAAPAPAPVATYAPPPPHQGMSTLAKVGIAFVVFVVLAGAAGIVGAIYVAHRVKQKIHEVAGGLVPESSSHAGTSSGSASSFGDVCRFLSKDEVGRALKVSIVGTKSEGDGCSYLVHGDAADLTAKHVAAMGGSHGADSQQQNLVQNFAGAIFKSQPTQGHSPTTDADGNAPVLVIGVGDNGLEQMRLEKTTLGRFPGSEQLSGIGDEAFVVGDTMMTVRKGNRLLRLMYSTCPCTTNEIKPLAKKFADGL